MKKLIAIVLLLVACGDDEHVPDVMPDCGVVADADVSPDATACWMIRNAQCGPEIYYQVCVPYDGCVYWYCGATKYGYCGPEGVFVP